MPVRIIIAIIKHFSIVNFFIPVMIVKNKIHQKQYKAKLEAAIKELQQAMNINGIASMRNHLLYRRLCEYRATSHASKDSELENIRPNAHQQPDSLELQLLGREVEELRKENARLSQQSHPQKQDASIDSPEIKEFISNLESRNVLLEKENCSLQIELQNLKSEIEALSEPHQRVPSRASLQASSFDEQAKQAAKSADLARAHCQISELGQEIEKYRQRILGLNRDVAVESKKYRNLREEMNAMRSLYGLLQQIQARKVDTTSNSPENILGSELNRMIDAFEKAVNAGKALERIIEQVHEKNEGLFSENAELKNRIKMHEESKMLLEKERKRCEGARDDIQNAIKELSESLLKQDRQSKEIREMIQTYEDRIGELEIMVEKLKASKKLAVSLEEELVASRGQVVSQRNEIERQKRILCLLKKRYGSTDEIENIDDIDMYRKVIRCGLCDVNLKNCVIVKCMHCFCEECVKKRFKARNRRCPTCAKDFLMTDVKKIYF